MFPWTRHWWLVIKSAFFLYEVFTNLSLLFSWTATSYTSCLSWHCSLLYSVMGNCKRTPLKPSECWAVFLPLINEHGGSLPAKMVLSKPNNIRIYNIWWIFQSTVSGTVRWSWCSVETEAVVTENAFCGGVYLNKIKQRSETAFSIKGIVMSMFFFLGALRHGLHLKLTRSRRIISPKTLRLLITYRKINSMLLRAHRCRYEWQSNVVMIAGTCSYSFLLPAYIRFTSVALLLSCQTSRGITMLNFPSTALSPTLVRILCALAIQNTYATWPELLWHSRRIRTNATAVVTVIWMACSAFAHISNVVG